MKRLVLVLTALAASIPATAGVRYGFGFYGGPVYGYGPYWGPAYGPYLVAHPNAGEVRFDTKDKEAQVFVNGAFAGTVHDLKKSLWLRQGTYNIELRASNGEHVAEQIFVATGKTLHMHLA